MFVRRRMKRVHRTGFALRITDSSVAWWWIGYRTRQLSAYGKSVKVHHSPPVWCHSRTYLRSIPRSTALTRASTTMERWIEREIQTRAMERRKRRFISTGCSPRNPRGRSARGFDTASTYRVRSSTQSCYVAVLLRISRDR